MKYQDKKSAQLEKEVKLLVAILNNDDMALFEKINQEIAWDFDNADKPQYTENEIGVIKEMYLTYTDYIHYVTGNTSII